MQLRRKKSRQKKEIRIVEVFMITTELNCFRLWNTFLSLSLPPLLLPFLLSPFFRLDQISDLFFFCVHKLKLFSRARSTGPHRMRYLLECSLSRVRSTFLIFFAFLFATDCYESSFNVCFSSRLGPKQKWRWNWNWLLYYALFDSLQAEKHQKIDLEKTFLLWLFFFFSSLVECKSNSRRE